MTPIEPTLDYLAVAKSILLTPFGFYESHLTMALNAIKIHKVDEGIL